LPPSNPLFINGASAPLIPDTMYAITEAILRETAAKKGWDVIQK